MLLLSFNSFTQPYNFRYFNQSTGLGSSNIKEIVQDDNGFMWFGSQDGITRFDGKNSLVIKEPLLGGTDVSDLFYDTETSWLWISYSLGGFNAINTRTVEVVYTSNNKPNIERVASGTIRKIRVDKKGRLWLGTKKGLFLIPDIKQDNIRPVFDNDATRAGTPYVYGLAEDNNGNIIASISGKGVVLLKDGDPFKKEFFYFNEPNANTYNASFNTLNNRFWIAGDGGVFCFDIEKRRLEQIGHPSQREKTAYYAAEDNNGYLWISGITGVSRLSLESNISDPIDFNEGKKNDLYNIASYIYFDHGGNTWIGTMAGCYYTTAVPSPFIKIIKSDKGNPLNHLYFLYPREQSILACDEIGLYKMDRHTQRVTILDSSLYYTLFFKDSKGSTLCSSSNGLFFWDDAHNKPGVPATYAYPELREVANYTLSSIQYINDSVIVLGSNSNTGIYIWNFRNHSIININDTTRPLRLRDASVIGVCRKNDHAVLILTNTSVELLDLQDHTLQNLTGHFPGMSYFYDMVALDGKYFLGTYGSGVIETDGSFNTIRTFSTATGLSNNCVYKIIAEHDGIIWATTNYGLNRINTRSGKVSNYYMQDGLHSNEFEEYSGNSDGKYIYAGGINGFTIINPSKFTTNTTPPICYFTTIKVTNTDSSKNIDTANLEMDQIIIPSNWLQATISFTGINYSNPTRVTYQYRIMEKDTNWISLDKQDFISLIGLSPGTYHLQVKAANEDGYWSIPKTLALEFEPRWFQTVVFKTAVIMSIIGLFYAFYRYRIRQIQKQQEIRHTIAGDLHDDIGATLNSLKIFTHMAETAENKTPHFTQMRESLVQASTGLRDMIWVLDDNDDTVEKLVTRLMQFTTPLAGTQGIRVEWLTDGANDHMLTKTEKRNILLIIKEAVNNCIKYADCKNIAIRFNVDNKKLTVNIKDDGKGFDMNNYKPGNGLVNIQERAKQIKFTATITSAEGSGTEIIVAAV